MKSAYLTPTFLFLGILIGADIGLYIPAYHVEEFLREVVILPAVFGGVWEYELWGNVLGIVVTLAALSRFGAGLALRFGIGYSFAFSVVIVTRAPEHHRLWLTLLGSILGVVAVVLVAKLLAACVVYSSRKYALDHRRWASWSLPTKASLFLGALGALGLLISILGWFGIQAHDLIPGIEGRRSDLLRFPYRGNIIELHGSDGSSMAHPIQILGARETDGGVPSEYYWINTYYPQRHRISQRVLKIPTLKVVSPVIRHSDGKQFAETSTSVIPSRCFDVVVLQDWFGRKSTHFFDITDFFNCDEFDSSHFTGMAEILH